MADFRIEVMISQDKMSASINIVSPDPADSEVGSVPHSDALHPDEMRSNAGYQKTKGLSSQEIIKILNDQKVIYGILKEKIQEVCVNPEHHYNQEIVAAEGVPPVHGINGRMQYHFQITKDRTPKILEDGRVNFHEMNLIQNVHAGDVLITIIPPVPGTPGMNVLGQPISPIGGKPVVPPRGKNVEVSKDGSSLIASVDGQVVIIDQKVHVYSLYEVPADVDNSTGNISFIGNVVVRGSVLTGFSIEAGGYVEVHGVVEGATIKAGGDIILRSGMQGANRGELISDHSITARYIENSILTAKEDIRCEAIMNSTVRCGGILELQGIKGLIVGGVANVGKEIRAKVIGSYMETVTQLEVGTDPIYREQYKSLKEEIVKVENDIEKAEQAIQLLRKLESLNALTEQKKVMLQKSVKTNEYLRQNLRKMKGDLEVIEQKMEEEGYGKIKIKDMIYPGCRVAIGSCMMYIKQAVKFATLYRDKADIKIGAYER